MLSMNVMRCLTAASLLGSVRATTYTLDVRPSTSLLAFQVYSGVDMNGNVCDSVPCNNPIVDMYVNDTLILDYSGAQVASHPLGIGT